VLPHSFDPWMITTEHVFIQLLVQFMSSLVKFLLKFFVQFLNSVICFSAFDL
jgi:hypothetical protein